MEELCENLDLRPGMKVLDMGCGKGLTSIFLAKEYGVTVFANDLWISATDNLKRFEAAGVADHTVIALTADHYPYGWEKAKYDELAGHEIDPYFEIYRNDFILWSEGMTQNVVIDEPCSSMDVLPTLSNLFGLEYDSRLMMGQDILSDAPPLVILSNRSFITDKVMYNSETGETTLLTNEPLPDGYVDNITKIVKNKFNVSKSILNLDYYRHIFSNYPEGFE
jgi:phosphoglycerol transferase MdoB-like AlkP superfamily enzyme